MTASLTACSGGETQESASAQGGQSEEADAQGGGSEGEDLIELTVMHK